MTPCPCCGMTHADPQANRGRCRNCPCVAELRSQIAALEFRCGKAFVERGRAGGKARGPRISTPCVCEACKTEYMAAGKRSRWCPICRPHCYRRWHLDKAIAARAARKTEEYRRSLARAVAKP